ncbi:hypothetical protein ACQKKG_08180 [Brevundimonas sp. NPDC003935]|uniref:hypothetical protein n=1 Tax=unclassified Brevundimonas TaxID=2622653 RepID=UPI0036B947D3
MRALVEELSSSGLDQVAWYGVPLPGGEIEDLLDKLPSKPHPAEVQTLSPPETAAWLSLLATQSLNHGTARGISRDEAGLLCRTIEVALNDLSPSAEFLAIGAWEISRRLKHWERLRADGPWMDRRYSLHFSGPYIEGRGVLGAIMGFDEKAAFLFAVIEDD